MLSLAIAMQMCVVKSAQQRFPKLLWKRNDAERRGAPTTARLKRLKIPQTFFGDTIFVVQFPNFLF